MISAVGTFAIDVKINASDLSKGLQKSIGDALSGVVKDVSEAGTGVQREVTSKGTGSLTDIRTEARQTRTDLGQVNSVNFTRVARAGHRVTMRLSKTQGAALDTRTAPTTWT